MMLCKSTYISYSINLFQQSLESQSCCPEQIGDTKRKCNLEEEGWIPELLLSFQFKTFEIVHMWGKHGGEFCKASITLCTR